MLASCDLHRTGYHALFGVMWLPMVFRAPRAKAMGADIIFVLDEAWLDLARLTCLPALMRTGHPTLQRDSCRCDPIVSAAWLALARLARSLLCCVPATRRFGATVADVMPWCGSLVCPCSLHAFSSLC